MVNARKKMRVFEERLVVIEKFTKGFGREHEWVEELDAVREGRDEARKLVGDISRLIDRG